jgi:hypothetical protein
MTMARALGGIEMMRRSFPIAAVLTAMLLTASVGALRAQEEEAGRNPVLADLTQRVAMTVPQTTLGKLIEFLAQETGVALMVDERYSSTLVSLLGAEGELGEVLSAIETATGMTFRKVDDIYFLARSEEGIATIAHRERRQRYARMVTTQNELAAAALRTLQPIVDRLGLSDRVRLQISNLTPNQQLLLYRQGYLTIGQLFPQTSTPLFDVLRQAMTETGAPESSLVDFAQRRVYFNPGLVFELYVPIAERAQPYLWSIDLFGAPAP